MTVQVEVRDASGLWGADAWATIKEIKKAHDRKAAVACIGVGGEKLARFASIENGPYGAWGRTGLGAVMGSKNLKAVAVRGTGDITVADPAGLPAGRQRHARPDCRPHHVPAMAPVRLHARTGHLLCVGGCFG